MTTIARRFILNEAGQGLVEYALIIALISVIAIAGLTFVRDKADNTLLNSANSMR